MTAQFSIPNPETTKRLIANLRRSCLVLEAATLELENITMQLENENRQKRLIRLKQAITNSQ
ncbi:MULTISPECIES: hypothetical protein [Spirulina sp. CCY15215]|uniref:hypothetical protein n=1 Tax=Spirulina sp. CCY15215 TaxID=2767591 RepID=UPI0019517126|nr:hypothetical protein [Spirulina major]